MKVSAVRDAAERYSLDELDRGIAAITEHERDLLEVGGDDIGERLTHLLIARRIRARCEAGEGFKSAFRTEFRQVRETLKD